MSVGRQRAMADLELLTRRAPAKRTSWDAETRTLDVVVSTFADVQRYGHIERLSREPADWDLSRVAAPGGMAFLLSHDAYTPGAKIGRVLSITVGPKDVRAKVKLSRKSAADALVRDLEDGIGVPVSFGYSVPRWQRDEGDGDGPEIRTAKTIKVLEVSAVSIPADAGAYVRSNPMSKSKTAAAVLERDDDDEIEEREGAAERMERAEEERVTRIHAYGSRLNLDPKLIRRGVKRGLSIEEFRELALEEHYQRYERRPQTRNHWDMAEIYGREDRRENVREQAVTGLAALLGAKPKADAPTEFVGRSVLEIGRAVLEAGGAELRGVSDRDIARMLTGAQPTFAARAYHTTSDFPLLLTEGVQRAAIERFEAQPSVLLQFSRKRNQKDFRPTTFVRPGEAPDLLPLNEHGEVESGTLSLESEVFRIRGWGRMIAFSFEALVNDDLSVLEDAINSFVDAGTNRVGDELFTLLAENSFGGRKTRDGKSFFHADHGNKAASGGAIGVTTVGAAEEAMRLQKNVSGVAGRAGMSPATLLVGPKRVTEARKFLAEIAAATTADVNPYSGKLRLAIEDRYDGTGWWLFGSKPAFVHGYLEGYPEGPRIESREGWNVRGTEWRAVMDFGAGVYDYRAAYFNPGA